MPVSISTVRVPAPVSPAKRGSPSAAVRPVRSRDSRVDIAPKSTDAPASPGLDQVVPQPQPSMVSSMSLSARVTTRPLPDTALVGLVCTQPARCTSATT